MMLTTLSPPEGLLGRSSDTLKLRMTDDGGASRIVDVESARCTFGADPRCTVRLDRQGIEPWHCLILHGARRTVVRRLAAQTRLNGREFDDAVLRPGDVLQMGPLSFEVLPSRPPAERSGLPSGSTAQAAHRQRAAEEAIGRLQAELQRTISDHEAERSDWQRRQWEAETRQAGTTSELARLGGQLAHVQRLLETERQLAGREVAQAHEQHARRVAELAALRRNLGRPVHKHCKRGLQNWTMNPRSAPASWPGRPRSSLAYNRVLPALSDASPKSASNSPQRVWLHERRRKRSWTRRVMRLPGCAQT
ncbi:MAG TPA: FHA domain-containing protein [Pirellulales bacterium]|nr:FHA domain-containing protein [Pirellulales bacterium]